MFAVPRRNLQQGVAHFAPWLDGQAERSEYLDSMASKSQTRCHADLNLLHALAARGQRRGRSLRPIGQSVLHFLATKWTCQPRRLPSSPSSSTGASFPIMPSFVGRLYLEPEGAVAG